MNEKSYSGFLGLGTFFKQLQAGNPLLDMGTTYIKNKWLAKKVFQFKFITEAIYKSDYETLSHIYEEWQLNRRWKKVWPYLGRVIHRGIVITPHSEGYCEIFFTKKRLKNTDYPDCTFVGVPKMEIPLTWQGTRVLIKILQKTLIASDYDAWFQRFSAANLKTEAIQICREHHAFGCWYQNERIPGNIELFEKQRRKDYYDHWEYYRKFWDNSYPNN